MNLTKFSEIDHLLRYFYLLNIFVVCRLKLCLSYTSSNLKIIKFVVLSESYRIKIISLVL